MSSIPVLISSALLLCLFIQCEAQTSYLVNASSSASDGSSSSEVSTSSDSDDSGSGESCNPDEVLSECIQNECRITLCSQRGQSILCTQPVSEDLCTSGCVCPVGTLRNEEGVCVPEDQCPGDVFPVIVCPENEIISDCSQNVCGGYCSQKGYALPCAAIAEEYCQRGCVCQPGYLRTAEGNCISEERCYGDLVCDENEIANSCPGTCNDFCPTTDLPRDINCFGTEQDSTACGEPKCTCRFNYRRDNNNLTCIPTRECPPFDCSSGPNQVYDPCPPLCPTDDCSQATPDGRCPLIGRIGIVVECEPACRCAPGYWRDNGVCVPYLACPGKCPPNEEFSNCSNALCRAQDCSQRYGPIACPSVTQCEESCVCIEGTLRNENGECVPENECPPLTCGENEQLNECTNGCDSDICPTVEELERLKDCVAPAVCGPPRCDCLPGYARDGSGNCIPLEECPPICPNSEEFSNCTQRVCRPETCSQFESDECIVCRRIPDENCALGCVCVEGTVRAKDGSCIPEELCSIEKYCVETERLVICTNNCDSDICPTVEELARQRDCVAPAVCGRPLCKCRPGYARDEIFNCIPLENCPPICPPNEEYSTCSNALCRAENCSQLGYPIACPDVTECEESCVCIEGTLRNENGECVPESECPPPICGENEQLNECTNGCDSDICPTINELVRLKNCVAPAVCGPPRCDCLPGYARDASGNCIPLEDCPPICPPDEEFSNCTQTLCRPQFCPQLDGSLSCRQPTAEEDCFLGCVCVEGKLRGADGRCIPVNQCGEEFCEENEQLQTCTNRCDSDICPTVAELKRRRTCIAPAVCGPPRCMCKPGYGRDESGNCIPLDSCPSICPRNEEYSTCSNALCRAQDCSQLGLAVACPSGPECEESCVCIERTLRNENGECVPENECLAAPTCGENEQLNECTNGCDSDICPTIDELERRRNCVAPAVCGPPRCDCLPGYGRDDSGSCIPLDSCPPVCPSDEELSDCVESVCRPQNCTDLNVCTNCRPYPNEDCSYGCVCVEGLVRGNDGRCIPEDQCGSELTCGPNEEVACVNECPPERTCRNKGIFFNCAQTDEKCQLKCICKEGYNRNYLGECITDAQCDQCSKDYEFFSCGQECDNECAIDYQNRTTCPIINIVCNPMCYCEDGYARDYQDNCIPLDQCPIKQQCGLNEEFGCVRTCPPETCLSLVARFKCDSKEYEKCNLGCKCKSGFLRQDNKSPCLPICKCKEMQSSPDCPKKVC